MERDVTRVTWNPSTPMKHYLALDQASRRIGWAIGSPEMLAPICGVCELPPAGTRHGIMLGAARVWLDATIKTYHVEKLCFETPFCGLNEQSYALVNKLIGVIELVCEENGIDCFEAMPAQWRKRFIGRAQAPKEVGINAAPKKRGEIRRKWIKEQAMRSCASRRWDARTDDEAEACGILDYFLACEFPDYGAKGGSPLLEEVAA